MTMAVILAFTQSVARWTSTWNSVGVRPTSGKSCVKNV